MYIQQWLWALGEHTNHRVISATLLWTSSSGTARHRATPTRFTAVACSPRTPKQAVGVKGFTQRKTNRDVSECLRRDSDRQTSTKIYTRTGARSKFTRIRCRWLMWLPFSCEPRTGLRQKHVTTDTTCTRQVSLSHRSLAAPVFTASRHNLNHQLVQFRTRWYLCARKSPYALHLGSQTFPQRCLRNGSNVLLIDDGPLSSFQGRSSSISSFHAYLLQAIDVLALCPHVAPQAPQHFRSFETQDTCPGRCIQDFFFFWKWMSTLDIFQSGIPILFFTFCNKFIESVRMMAYVVRLSPLEAIQRRAWVTASTSIVQLEVETIVIGCTVFMDGSCTLLDSEAPPWLVFGDSDQCTLWGLTVFCFPKWESANCVKVKKKKKKKAIK